jgi:cardiolipin synthase
MSLLRKNRWQNIDSLILLEGGSTYFPAIEEHLQLATKSIYLEAYIFSADTQAKKISDLLCLAAHRGVEVKLIIDWLGSAPLLFESDLIAAGVQVSYYNKGWFGRFGFSRTHRKLLVIDGMTAFVGGINICDDHLDARGKLIGGVRWDLAVQVSGKVVEHVHIAFLRQWQRLQAGALHPKNIIRRIFEQELPWSSSHFMGVHHGSHASIAFIARDNLHHRRDIERAYLKAIGQSREEIWLVTPYFMPARLLRKSLIRAAQRGVTVNLLLGRDEFEILNWAVPSLYGQFLEVGINIYEYAGQGQLHAKAMVVDRRWATIGSSNCDHLSFFLNHEANLILRNHEVVKEMRWRIADQVAEHAHAVDPQAYMNRSIFLKVANWISYRMVRLIVGVLVIGIKDKALVNQGD